MEIKEIIKLVVDTLEVNKPNDMEVLCLPHGREDHVDARSIIFKLADIDEHPVQAVSKELGCTTDMGIYALERFHKVIHTRLLFSIKFEQCLKKYFELENITI